MRWPPLVAVALLAGSAALTWRTTGSALAIVPYAVPCLLCLALAAFSAARDAPDESTTVPSAGG